MVPVIAGLGHKQIEAGKPHFGPVVVAFQAEGSSRHETKFQGQVSQVNGAQKAQTRNFSFSTKVRELQADLF